MHLNYSVPCIYCLVLNLVAVTIMNVCMYINKCLPNPNCYYCYTIPSSFSWILGKVKIKLLFLTFLFPLKMFKWIRWSISYFLSEKKLTFDFIHFFFICIVSVLEFATKCNRSMLNWNGNTKLKNLIFINSLLQSNHIWCMISIIFHLILFFCQKICTPWSSIIATTCLKRWPLEFSWVGACYTLDGNNNQKKEFNRSSTDLTNLNFSEIKTLRWWDKLKYTQPQKCRHCMLTLGSRGWLICVGVYGKIILLLTLDHRSVNTLLTSLWSQLLGLSALQYGIMFIL